jgi:hypothetical protein
VALISRESSSCNPSTVIITSWRFQNIILNKKKTKNKLILYISMLYKIIIKFYEVIF